MSATNNVFSTPDNLIGNLNGLFKDTWAKQLKDLQPDSSKLLTMINFAPKGEQPGNLFNQPVVLGQEHGITFAQSVDDAFALAPAISGLIQNAVVRGSPAVLRSVIGYNAASRAAQGGTQAFMDATKFVVGNMLKSMAKKIEIEMLYGQVGYGTIDANTVAATTFVVADAEWAPGIWVGSEKMPIEIRSANGAVSRGIVQVVEANLETRTITVDGALTLTAGDVIWHKGAYGNEFIGLHRIIQQSGLTTLFNVSTSFNLFKGNTYDAQGGALSFAKLNQAITRAVEKGVEGKVTVFVSSRGWANMLNDQAALRKYDGSYSRKKLENGAEALTFYSQSGELEIIPHTMVKESYAYMVQLSDFMRIGSSDITFKRPGMEVDGNFFKDASDLAGYELRCFTDQALFCCAPGRQVLIYNIVNNQ